MKNSMKNFIKFSWLFLFVTLISCETEKIDIINYGGLSGRVLDAETYLPLNGVLITTTPASASIISDADGKFTIPKIKEGEVAINMKKGNYLSNSLTVAVFKNETTQMDLLIFKDNNNIGEISVYDPVPGNGAVDQALSLDLIWKVDGQKVNTDFTYNIYLFESNSTVQNLLGEDVVLNKVTTSGLKTSTTYYWYVVVKYKGNKVAFSPTWSFKTGVL